jgi:hypothetical protein
MSAIDLILTIPRSITKVVGGVLHRRSIMGTKEAHTFLGDSSKLEQRNHLETKSPEFILSATPNSV